MRRLGLFGHIIKGSVVIAAILLVCRATAGVGGVLLAVIAIVLAFGGKLAYALSLYCLFGFMVVMSHYILPKTTLLVFALRLAPIGIALGLLFSASRRVGREALPVGMLWAYLGVSCLSSAIGYCPSVSYMKIVNFAILLVGLHFGLRNIDRCPSELERARTFIFSLCFFLVIGCLATLPFPSIAYSTSVGLVAVEEGMDAAADSARQIAQNGGALLFAGLTNQSQVLGIMIPCVLAWLLCDMLFVERRITKTHLVAVCAAFPLVYMCRSRTAFVSTCVALFVIVAYCLRRVPLSHRVKRTLHGSIWIGGIVLCGIITYMEVKNQSMTKYLRKYEDGTTNESLTEAFTKTRIGKVDENMADFYENPLLGMGFQVVREMKGMKGFRLSAPIEKSVLPTMVLGETGLVGGAVFFVFLCTFYGTCVRRRYYCTLTAMSTFLATNLSEATFFSPGGVGGVMWIFCCVGGFVDDMIIKNHEKNVALFDRFVSVKRVR